MWASGLHDNILASNPVISKNKLICLKIGVGVSRIALFAVFILAIQAYEYRYNNVTHNLIIRVVNQAGY